MIQSDITAPILSYDDINKRAEDLLREYKRNKILPVDIEAIAGRIGVKKNWGQVYFVSILSFALKILLIEVKYILKWSATSL